VNYRPLTPGDLMAKADTACSSARTLLDLGDVDGAANRAYYAMFDAARDLHAEVLNAAIRRPTSVDFFHCNLYRSNPCLRTSESVPALALALA